MLLPDPLPRALTPLPGEGLPGLLLRLGHRLDVAPFQLIQRTGIHDSDAYIPGRLLLTLDARLAVFAHATRLTTTEAAQLTLDSYVSCFPPVAESLKTKPGVAATRAPVDAWVLSHYTRYCPRCLAGNGTLIQQRHGGPWKAEWRLPVIFTCPEHDTFLHHLCPACARPAHAFHIGGSKLMPLIRLPGLHPAQCRNPHNDALPNRLSFCDARLDTPTLSAGRPPVSPPLAGLQERIRHQLSPAGNPAESRRYFTGLRVLTSILAATWPLGREFALAAAPESVDQDLAERRHQAAIRPPGARGRVPFTTWDHPPRSALATATLLHAADQILALNQTELRHALHMMLRSAPTMDSGRWGRSWHHLAHYGAPALNREITGALRKHALAGLRGPAVNLHKLHYRIQHIPQWLPEHWLPHLRPGVPLAPLLRALHHRAAAVRLIQMASGMTLEDAARYLGIPDTWYTDPHHLRLPTNPFFYDEQTTQLAGTLHLLGHTSDYHRRRQHLASWTLPDADWDTIWQQAIITGQYGRPKAVRHLHQVASEFVWTRITGSERSLAPALPGLTSGCRTTRHMWLPLTCPTPTQRLHGFYRALRELLKRYAHHLAVEAGHRA
ncbi:TniQ family protein [Streptomyces sp. URMC 127]|uniref:TniQ family protein n=1 Tax=Streptomyces sp. URMC 127 TaxID=3423402 RepID=UPI003F1972C0